LISVMLNRSICQNILRSLPLLENKVPPCSSLSARSFNIMHIDRPTPGTGRQYKYQVIYPEDGKYTIKHLPCNHLHGRDPETGRKVVRTWGVGRYTKYRWIDFNRRGPTEPDSFKEEKIIEIQYDPNREPFIALVGSGSHLRYILATSTMMRGDVIRSSNHIPEIPGRGVPGDSYALGALANGTEVCHIEQFPGQGAFYHLRQGAFGEVKRRLADGRVVIGIKMMAKGLKEVALDPNCNAVVGRISNEDADKVHVGTYKRLFWLGWKSRSGLEQKKSGYHGRKLRHPGPVVIPKPPPAPLETIRLTSETEGIKRRVVPKSNIRRKA